METIIDTFADAEFPIEMLDKNDNPIFYADKDHPFYDGDIFWIKRDYDSLGRMTGYRNNLGESGKTVYNNSGSYELRLDNNGWWEKTECDANGTVVYRESSNRGIVIDKRTSGKTFADDLKELAKKHKVNIHTITAPEIPHKPLNHKNLDIWMIDYINLI